MLVGLSLTLTFLVDTEATKIIVQCNVLDRLKFKEYVNKICVACTNTYAHHADRVHNEFATIFRMKYNSAVNKSATQTSSRKKKWSYHTIMDGNFQKTQAKKNLTKVYGSLKEIIQQSQGTEDKEKILPRPQKGISDIHYEDRPLNQTTSVCVN